MLRRRNKTSRSKPKAVNQALRFGSTLSAQATAFNGLRQWPRWNSRHNFKIRNVLDDDRPCSDDAIPADSHVRIDAGIQANQCVAADTNAPAQDGTGTHVNVVPDGTVVFNDSACIHNPVPTNCGMKSDGCSGGDEGAARDGCMSRQNCLRMAHRAEASGVFLCQLAAQPQVTDGKDDWPLSPVESCEAAVPIDPLPRELGLRVVIIKSGNFLVRKQSRLEDDERVTSTADQANAR